jgi:NAD+ kinase
MNRPQPTTAAAETRSLRAFVLGFGGRPNVVEEAHRLRPIIEQHVDVVAFDLAGKVDLSRLDADLAIVLGGDGSILRAAHQMGERQVPVLAVNLGRLGFLADLAPTELAGVLHDFTLGKLKVVEHLMFDCQVIAAGQVKSQKLGLNEVAVHGGSPFSIVNIDLYVDSELVTTYSCDGLILATPVGSTAHSLSAGGPILRKSMQAFVISPISPHTLTNRPVVDTADHVYELVVPKPTLATSLVVDGVVICTLTADDRVRVQRAEPRFKLVTAPGHSYYRTLREKLGWSGRLQVGNWGPQRNS